MAKYNMYVEDVSVEAVFNYLGGVEGAKRCLRGERELVDVEIASESPLDFTVRVDRSVSPGYPPWSDKVMHPDLDCTGPEEYDLQQDVEEWRHDDQKTGVVKGDLIYEALKRDNALANQLGLSDLLSIQKMGIGVFRALFEGKAVFGWKSVVRFRDDRDLLVPFLCEGGGIVVLRWVWLVSGWSSSSPALRFRK